MTRGLSFEDRRYLADLVNRDERRRPADVLVGWLALALGGLLVVAASIVVLRDLRDATVLAVLVPGFSAGLFLLVIHLAARARVRDRHRMATIARKLRSAC